MKKLICFVLVSALVLFLAGCSPARDADTIRVVLDWTPNTNHTGLYVALEKGYYRDAGFPEVEIAQPPEETAVMLAASGSCEFAIGFQESMGPSFASAAPVPVTAIAALIQHNTSGIMALKSSGIATPKDLMGKRYATWGSSFVTEVIRAVVEADGGIFEEVQMIPNSATDAISALKTDIDAIWIYYAWDGIAAGVKGEETNYISLQEYVPALDFYTPVLITGNQYLQEHPDKVRAFLAATAKGYEYAIANPDEAAGILLQYAPELDAALVRESQQWLAGQYKAEVEQWGYIDPARWSAFYGWMWDKGLLEKELGASGFTNEYLPD